MNIVNKILKEAILNEVYYHGTSSEQNGISILEKGLVPGVPIEDRKKGHMLKPVAGKVYLTNKLETAVIYTIGGIMMGRSISQQWIEKSRYGYLFKSKVIDDTNIQPDEDEIGELICDETIPELNRIAKYHLTPNQYRNVMDGEYSYWAQAGKKMIKNIQRNSYLWNEILTNTHNIAHQGMVEVINAWKFDKTLCEQLTSNGNNFFQIAEQVK